MAIFKNNPSTATRSGSEQTVDVDTLVKAIKEMQLLPRQSFYDAIAGHPNSIKAFEWNVPKVEGSPDGSPLVNMSFGVRTQVSPIIPAMTWKIPLLREDLDVSPHVRAEINATLMSFGKEPVVYAIDSAALGFDLFKTERMFRP